MKRIIKISLFSSLILLAACGEDFLEKPPLDAIVVDNFYQSTEQLRLATAGMYNVPWFDYNDKVNFSIGDGAAGNFLSNDPDMRQFSVFSANNSDARIGEAWRSMYIVIGQANNIIHSIKSRAGESIPEEDKNAAMAEARFMRGYAYHYLGMLFGEVPIIENNVALVSDPLIPKNTLEDVFQFAINDMKYAVEHLLEVDPQEGR
ncbi:MAG: RagB/SusD family nutrient uptake outer membrane protein, partial [Cyclobacteriaceae bacterium]